jgi:hypothetical protein
VANAGIDRMFGGGIVIEHRSGEQRLQIDHARRFRRLLRIDIITHVVPAQIVIALLSEGRGGAAAEWLAAHGRPRGTLAGQQSGAQRCEGFGFAHFFYSPVHWPATRRPKPPPIGRTVP